jgi:hypothetical protein
MAHKFFRRLISSVLALAITFAGVASAQAWGSVSDGTLNYTPELSLSASLDSVKSGTVVIGCN